MVSNWMYQWGVCCPCKMRPVVANRVCDLSTEILKHHNWKRAPNTYEIHARIARNLSNNLLVFDLVVHLTFFICIILYVLSTAS